MATVAPLYAPLEKYYTMCIVRKVFDASECRLNPFSSTGLVLELSTLLIVACWRDAGMDDEEDRIRAFITSHELDESIQQQIMSVMSSLLTSNRSALWATARCYSRIPASNVGGQLSGEVGARGSATYTRDQLALADSLRCVDDFCPRAA